MNTNEIQNIIQEANNRGGGLILNMDEKPAAVVLTIERYNQLLLGQTKTILVTGGAGYIGAHVVKELIKSGYLVVVVDNLSSGKKENIPDSCIFVEGDINNKEILRSIFSSYKIFGVMHFAASIEVEESVRDPQKYFKNNTQNTEILLETMLEFGVNKIIFSSTAAVYGNQEQIPIKETARLQPNNPYGYSKLLAERVIKYYSNFLGIKAIIFRYFNACGCDFDGQIQATHTTHLIPLVLKTALGKTSEIKVYGNDYNTKDGTCLRDYVHVLDISKAHVLALNNFLEGDNFKVYNIGTGKGCSVLEVINKTSEVLNKIIPMQMAPRRPGDAEATVADNSKITNELGFMPQYSDLDTIINTTLVQINKHK